MITDALVQWRAVLGDTKVDTRAETLERYGRSTQLRGTHPSCVLYPQSTEEVQAIVNIARTHKAGLYPLSRGKNWGYGDACAPMSGSAIVDLSRMNRIVEVNTELAYAVVEAGVSQGELFDYLEANGTNLWMDCTGAGPGASFVGNTLDHGFGHTRYGDHFASTCGMEVVLADGSVLNTGFGHFPNAKAGRVYPYGVGPYVDGIFCQSNFGIVTKIGMWLMPKPEAFCFFFITVERYEDLEPLVDRLRPLRMAGIITSALHIGNDLRILSSKRNYPWAETGGKTPLPEDVRAQMRKTYGISAWNAGGALTGPAGHVRSAKKALRNAVRGLGKLVFVDDTKLALAGAVIRGMQRFGLGGKFAEMLESLNPVYATLKGRPTEDALRGSMWRLRQAPPKSSSDPLEHGAGLYWLSPALPMTGRDALRVMAIVEPVFAQHGFELLATFTMINERAMIAILNVAFDKAVEEEAQRAEVCYHAAFEALMKEGYVPYRVGLSGLPKLYDPNDAFWRVAGQIKLALDPDDIISPGRYIAKLR
ncbi:MAG: FAD-binding oxidoreductase [Candidatus Hydrogenedentes bacterium]|nr:FAD-binding oxidoreductase [Candidatus Hydrogenedentota bacterium]